MNDYSKELKKLIKIIKTPKKPFNERLVFYKQCFEDYKKWRFNFKFPKTVYMSRIKTLKPLPSTELVKNLAKSVSELRGEFLQLKDYKPVLIFKLFLFFFAETFKAKNKIKSSLKDEQKIIAAEGKEILKRKLKHIKLPFNDSIVTEMINYFKYKTSLNLFYDVGTGVLNNRMIKEFAKNRSSWYQYLKSKLYRRPTKPHVAKEEIKYDTLVFGANEERLNYTLSKCCSPIIGDDVFGFTTIKEGIKVHRMNCPNAIRLQSNFAYRILETKWIDSNAQNFIAIINIKGIDKVGLINEITKILSNNLKINIQSINIRSTDGIFDGIITLMIHDKKHLKSVIDSIKKVEGITSVNRKLKTS